MGPHAVEPNVMATMLPLQQAVRCVGRPPSPEEHACEGEQAAVRWYPADPSIFLFYVRN
jgi:hypothetical protein